MSYLPNPLNEFDVYTYNIELYMVRPGDAAEYNMVIDTDNALLIADNVSLSNYNITNFEFITYTGKNQARNQIQGMFNMTLFEANGATLLDRIKTKAESLGIINHTQAIYLTRVTFNGRDDRGAAKQYRHAFIYAMKFTDFTFKVDEQGAVYQITAYEQTTIGYEYNNNVLKQTTTIEAETVGEFVQEFERVYAMVLQHEWALDPGRAYVDSYRFEFTGICREWLDWRFEALDSPNSVENNVVNGKLQIPLHNGSQLTALIHNVLALTREYKQIPTEGGFYRSNGGGEPATETLDTFPVLFKAIPDIIYREYDPLRQEFQKDITFKIVPYIAADMIVDQPSYEQGINNRSVQQNRVRGLLDSGLMRKKYEYLYTGKNTEILELDLSFNMIYYQPTALNGGQAGNPNDFAPQAIRDATSTLGRIAAAKAQIVDATRQSNRLPGQIDAARSQLNAATDDAGLNAHPSDGPHSPVLSVLNDAQNRLDDLNLQVGYNLRAQNRASAEFDGALRDYTTSRSAFAYPLRFRADVIDNADHGAESTGDDNGASFQFGATTAAYENPSDLLRIELGIRGDPYWLGRPKTVANIANPNSGTVDYLRGGNHIYIHSNLPMSNEDNAGLRAPSPDYQITAVYHVLNIVSKFSDGQFVQYLQCVMDTATNAQLAAETLEGGSSSGRPR